MLWEKYRRNQEANTVTLLPVKAIPVAEKVFVGEKGRNKMQHQKHRLHILISCYRNKQVCFIFSLLPSINSRKKTLRFKLVSVIKTLSSYIIALLNYFSLLSVDTPLKTSLKVRQFLDTVYNTIVKNKETKEEGLIFTSIA